MTDPTCKTAQIPARIPSPFEPAWWCANRHLQTVWRRAFGVPLPIAYRRERMELPDGDFLDVDWMSPGVEPDASAPIVLALHGLEGCASSKYIVGLLSCISRLGCRGVAMNFRSCSGEINRLLRSYHSGETLDLQVVVSMLVSRYPDSPLLIAGFSLGGNVLLKWLGENGDNIPHNVRAAAAVSVPFDLAVAARHIDMRMNRAVYAATFLRTLKSKMIEKTKRFPGAYDTAAIRQIRSFAEFDEFVTAPIHGFRNAEEYWRRSSSVHYLSSIRQPTLLLSAKDDPFLPGEYLPNSDTINSRWLTPEFYEHGGHVGFIGGSIPFRPFYWTDDRVARFLLENSGTPGDKETARRGTGGHSS